MTTLVRQLANVTPREGECERTYRALQTDARRILAGFANDEQSVSG